MSSKIIVERVRSNVKKSVDVTLSRLTLLVGPNGSGKTSVQNAVELATSAFASDVEGRVKVRMNHALGRLGPGDSTLWSEVEFSDGSKASWKLKPNKKGGFHDPEHDVPQNIKVIFPVADVREVLGGSPESIRTWLMSRVASDIREADILDRLPEDLHDAYRELAAKMRLPEWSEIDVLLAVSEAGKKEIRSNEAEAKKARQVIDTMTDGMGMEPTSSEIERAEAEVIRTEEAYSEGCNRPVSYPPNLDAIRSEALIAVGAFQRAAETAQLAKAAIPPMHPSEEALIEFRGKVADIAEVTANLNSPTCLTCDGPLGITDMRLKGQLLRQQNATGAAAVHASRIHREKEAEADRLRAAALRLAEALQNAERQASEYKYEPQVDLRALGDAVVRARSSMNELKLQKRTWNNMRSAKDDVRRLSERSKKYESLVEAASDVVDELLKISHKKFEAVVQAYLPSTDKFALVLVENKKPVCRMGFRRDEQLHTALSGAEWARLTLALGCATYKPTPETLPIFTPEERAFDPVTLREVMVALAQAPGQVLLQSPAKPAGRTPKDWRVIEMTSTGAVSLLPLEPEIAEA
jgi:hypothetical protein